MRRAAPPSVLRSGEPRRRRLTELVALPRRSPLHPELVRALAAADALHCVYTDLHPVPVRPTATTRRSGCYRMREGDPIDLRVSRGHDRVPLSFLHELGHLLDHQLVPQPRRFASPSHSAFRRWRAAVRALDSRAPSQASRTHRRYFDSYRELWARSYAQTVLVTAADEALREHLRSVQRTGDVFVWPEREFGPVAVEVLGVLERLGLLHVPAAAAA